MNRQFATALIIWLVLTAGGEAAVFANMFPTVGSHEAKDFDLIFRILMAAGIPVMAFVFAALGAVLIGYRVKGTPEQDGPAIFGYGIVPKAWLVVTGLLALSMMILGLAGLATLIKGDKSQAGWGDASEAQLVVKVNAYQFIWEYELPNGAKLMGTAANRPTIKLPVDTRVMFEVHGKDVIHSLWVPAFRMRIDAVPGHTTYFVTEPTELGAYDTDQAYRFQCSMLCGLDHSVMWNRLEVVERADFETWAAEQLAAQKKVGR